MATAPKQGFHFAATLEHAAAYIEAETIQEAEAIYKKVRKSLNAPAQPEQPAQPEDLPEDNK